MGEVYKARDTRLGRTVAIKVLPEHVASDPELRQRFEGEAKTLAALSHPHICPVYDVGTQGGIDFLVMEYLEGETLAQRLTRAAGAKGHPTAQACAAGTPPAPALQVGEALAIAIQIADALDKAHRKGIVHRDLKPGNIMLTKAGSKLLDFGLAKLIGPPEGGRYVRGDRSVRLQPDLSNAPTVSAPLTGAGSILGTFQYMAPEQLEGREADARTDIFAFGAVVYEMVTGRKAFEGKSQASLISAIMSSEPPQISAVGQVVPVSLDRVVRTCLAKDPDERFQSAHDLKRAIEWSIAGHALAPVPSSSKQWAAWAAAAAFAVLAAVGWLRSPLDIPLVPDMVLTIAPPEATGIAPITQLFGVPNISPDGSAVIYRDRSRGYQLRRLDSLSVEALRAPTVTGASIFWSPDSRSVLFDGGGALWRLLLAVGAPERVTRSDGPMEGGSLSASGVLLFTNVRTRTGLFTVLAAGGNQRNSRCRACRRVAISGQISWLARTTFW